MTLAGSAVKAARYTGSARSAVPRGSATKSAGRPLAVKPRRYGLMLASPPEAPAASRMRGGGICQAYDGEDPFVRASPFRRTIVADHA